MKAMNPGSISAAMDRGYGWVISYPLLAMAAIPAVLRNMPIGRLLVWIFNVEGTVDLIAVIALAAVHDASAYMGRPTGYLRCGSRRC